MRKIIIITFCFGSLLSSLFGQWPFGKDIDWYIDGPKKNWTKRDHDRYYRWRDRLSASRKAETTDEQILPRQKAILNGNKITTEIWNYGSISSPGNRVTDIVWETLGYGYEFGPFICAKVPLLSDGHQDAFYEVSKDVQDKHHDCNAVLIRIIRIENGLEYALSYLDINNTVLGEEEHIINFLGS